MNKKSDKLESLEGFSLSVGGPLYQIYYAAKLLNKPLLLCKRRIVFMCLLTWLPLLILALIGGVAFGGVKVPFIFDIDVHVRLLIALSMLIYAEVIAHDRIYLIAEQFLKTDIITQDVKPEYQRIIASAKRLRDSVIVEAGLILLVYTAGYWISTEYLPLGASTWYARSIGHISQLTPAGYWYVYISLPVFQFILLRWYFRIFVWYAFLWQVSRLPLKLNSLHPDYAGGLGFLANSVYAFEPFLLAHTILLSGMLFNRIWNAGAVVSDFQTEIASILCFLILIPLLPLLFFLFKMVKEKRGGTLEYGVVANHYVNAFRQKWIKSSTKNVTELLGSPDIQSLADLTNSFMVSNRMRVTPFSRNNVIAIIVVTGLPLLPLLLTVLPLEKIISQILGIIF